MSRGAVLALKRHPMQDNEALSRSPVAHQEHETTVSASLLVLWRGPDSLRQKENSGQLGTSKGALDQESESWA